MYVDDANIPFERAGGIKGVELFENIHEGVLPV